MAKFQGLKVTALYERLSKDDDLKGESNSISNQKKYLEDYARRNGFTNIKHYTDDGYTGTNFNRPGFQALISDVEDGNIETIIVKDMSRFGRNYLQVGFYTEMVFPQKNVRFIAINNSVDSNNPMDNDFTPFLNIMNEWYAKDTSNKIKSIFNARMSEGLRCSGSIPYGYNRLPDDKQKLVVDPVASKVVKRIFEMAAVGKTIMEIAKTLEEEKVLIPSAYTAKFHPEQNNGKKFKEPYRWRYGTITDIIKRREYLGHTVLKKSENTNFKLKNRKPIAAEDQLLFENTHEAIVDQELWDRAQKFRRKERTKKVKPNGTYTEGHLLSGFLFCADCGSRLRIAVGGTNREAPYFSFRCGKYANDRRECTAHSIGEKAMESLLLNTIQRIMKRIEIDEAAFAEELKSQYEDMKKEIPEQEMIELSKYEKRLSEVDNIVKGMYENFIAGLLSERQYRTLMTQYDEEQRQLENGIEELKNMIEEHANEPIHIQKFIDKIKEFTEPAELNEVLVHELVDKIIVHQAVQVDGQRTQKVEIYFNFVGEINLEYSEEELKELEAKAKAKRDAKVQRQRKNSKAHAARKKAERYAANEGHKFTKRICEHCGKEYWPNSNKQKYCSPECKYEHDRKVLLAKRYEEKGEHIFKQKNCIVCGKPFWPSNGQELMCSKECKDQHYKGYRKEHYEKRKAEISAKSKAERKARNEKLMAENEGHLISKRVCEHCGKEYWPAKQYQKYCSKLCGSRACYKKEKG